MPKFTLGDLMTTKPPKPSKGAKPAAMRAGAPPPKPGGHSGNIHLKRLPLSKVKTSI